MVAPVVNLPNRVKHNGISGRNTQLFCQHSGETPLRGGYARSLTNAVNADPSWQASWPSFVDPIERVRMVPWPYSAWTQGIANAIAVGLECAGYARFTVAQWLTPEGLKQLENLAHEWVYYWKKEKAAGNEIDLRWLSDAEVRKVLNGDKSINGFCTHKQIDPASRTDPGPNFPYARLMNRIKQLLGKGTTTASAPAESDDLMDWINSMFKSKEEFGEFLIQHGVGYDGRDSKDRDLWSKIETLPEDAAYKSIREPMTVRDWSTGEPVVAQNAAFLGTTWNQVHRRMPEYFKQVLAGQAQIQATLEALAQGSNIDMDAIKAAAVEGVRKGIEDWEQITAEDLATAVVDEQAERLTSEAK